MKSSAGKSFSKTKKRDTKNCIEKTCEGCISSTARDSNRSGAYAAQELARGCLSSELNDFFYLKLVKIFFGKIRPELQVRNLKIAFLMHNNLQN